MDSVEYVECVEFPMTSESREMMYRAILEDLKSESEDGLRDRMGRCIFIGPLRDGFTILFGPTFRQTAIGWWPTRELACEEAEKLVNAIRVFGTVDTAVRRHGGMESVELPKEPHGGSEEPV